MLGENQYKEEVRIMSGKETVTIEEAAVMLGTSKQGVREMMKRKIIDIGIVYPSMSTGRTNRYMISREKLVRFLKGD